ncbi:MAG: hypothetical protein ACRDK1_01000, partial [Solirubrobacterales bacterium]
GVAEADWLRQPWLDELPRLALPAPDTTLVVLAAHPDDESLGAGGLIATAAAAGVDRVGLPECRLNLAQAAVYLSLAPKSNASYVGIGRASAHVRRHGAKPPPVHLRDAHYPGAAELGRGVGYVYPHDEPDGFAGQPVIPEGLEGERFYEPTDRGAEAGLGRRLDEVRRRREEPNGEDGA